MVNKDVLCGRDSEDQVSEVLTQWESVGRSFIRKQKAESGQMQPHNYGEKNKQTMRIRNHTSQSGRMCGLRRVAC